MTLRFGNSKSYRKKDGTRTVVDRHNKIVMNLPAEQRVRQAPQKPSRVPTPAQLPKSTLGSQLTVEEKYVTQVLLSGRGSVTVYEHKNAYHAQIEGKTFPIGLRCAELLIKEGAVYSSSPSPPPAEGKRHTHALKSVNRSNNTRRGYGYEHLVASTLIAAWKLKDQRGQEQAQGRYDNYINLADEDKQELATWTASAVDVLTKEWKTVIPDEKKRDAYIEYAPSTQNVKDPSDIYIRAADGEILMRISCKAALMEERAYRPEISQGKGKSKVAVNNTEAAKLINAQVAEYPNMTWKQRLTQHSGVDSSNVDEANRVKGEFLDQVNEATAKDLLGGSAPTQRALSAVLCHEPHLRVGPEGRVEKKNPAFKGEPKVVKVENDEQTRSLVVHAADSVDPSNVAVVNWRVKFKDNWEKKGQSGSGVGYSLDSRTP